MESLSICVPWHVCSDFFVQRLFPQTDRIFTYFLAVAWIPNYALAYGFGDVEGLTFRRFFRKHHVRWDGVEKVEWSNSNLLSRQYVVITFVQRVGLFRKARFFVKDKSYRWGQPLREDWVPDILAWIMNQLRMQQPPRG